MTTPQRAALSSGINQSNKDFNKKNTDHGQIIMQKDVFPRADSPFTFHIPQADTEEAGDDNGPRLEIEDLNWRVPVIIESGFKYMESDIVKGKRNADPKCLVERSTQKK